MPSFFTVRRVEKFQLGHHGGHAALGQAVELDQWRVADQIGDIVGDAHVVLLW